MVTEIPSAPYTFSPFIQNPQSGPSASTSFVQGFPWNGGHIPPYAPYVGPSPTNVGVSFGNQNPFTGSIFRPLIQFQLLRLGALLFHCSVGGS